MILVLVACDQNTPDKSSEQGIAKVPIINQVEKAENYIDDSVINSKVEEAILEMPYLKASQLEVTTVNRVVTLNGTVDSDQTKTKLSDLVNAQENIKAAQNNLIVDPSILSKSPHHPFP